MSMERIITEELIKKYEGYLYEEEKAPATIRKYICDLRKLQKFAKGREIDKKRMIQYKESLHRDGNYTEGSANSILVAANCFFRYLEWQELTVKLFRIQREIFCPDGRYLTKAEYRKLVQTAKACRKRRLVMMTLPTVEEF